MHDFKYDTCDIWIGKNTNKCIIKKLGCEAYFHIDQIMRNTLDVPGKKCIMVGCARERRGYCTYDIKNKKVIKEWSVKFNETLK